MSNKSMIIGRLGQNAEAKTAANSREYAVLNIATQESSINCCDVSGGDLAGPLCRL